MHQANRVDDWELPEEELKCMVSSRNLFVLLLLLYLELLKLPFSLFGLPLQFIHLFDEVSKTFLFSNKLFPKHSLRHCLCSGGACQDTSILQKKGVATELGVDLAMGEAKDLGNNISTYHWFMPICNRFCSHSFHSFLWNSSSKH